jgi:murein DD-endopeptidase MepM/ murein hydrolase activator NlpD
MPLEENKITSVFGPRGGRMHSGMDLDLETGDPIYSAFDGIVRVTGWDGGGYGKFVMVRHYNGLETMYGHMTKNDIVVTGQLIKAGDLIGLGGSTGRSSGSHLHYETRYEGNPFNPQHIFEFHPKNAIVGEHFLLTPEIFRSNYYNLRNEYGIAGEKVRLKKTVWYKVRNGDTPAEIAQNAGISLSRLYKLNRLTSRSTLNIGRKLRIK